MNNRQPGQQEYQRDKQPYRPHNHKHKGQNIADLLGFGNSQEQGFENELYKPIEFHRPLDLSRKRF